MKKRGFILVATMITVLSAITGCGNANVEAQSASENVSVEVTSVENVEVDTTTASEEIDISVQTLTKSDMYMVVDGSYESVGQVEEGTKLHIVEEADDYYKTEAGYYINKVDTEEIDCYYDVIDTDWEIILDDEETVITGITTNGYVITEDGEYIDSTDERLNHAIVLDEYNTENITITELAQAYIEPVVITDVAEDGDYIITAIVNDNVAVFEGNIDADEANEVTVADDEQVMSFSVCSAGRYLGDAQIQACFDQFNRMRAEKGLEPFTWGEDKAQALTDTRAEEIVNDFSHDGMSERVRNHSDDINFENSTLKSEIVAMNYGYGEAGQGDRMANQFEHSRPHYEAIVANNNHLSVNIAIYTTGDNKYYCAAVITNNLETYRYVDEEKGIDQLCYRDTRDGSLWELNNLNTEFNPNAYIPEPVTVEVVGVVVSPINHKTIVTYKRSDCDWTETALLSTYEKEWGAIPTEWAEQCGSDYVAPVQQAPVAQTTPVVIEPEVVEEVVAIESATPVATTPVSAPTVAETPAVTEPIVETPQTGVVTTSEAYVNAGGVEGTVNTTTNYDTGETTTTYTYYEHGQDVTLNEEQNAAYEENAAEGARRREETEAMNRGEIPQAFFTTDYIERDASSYADDSTWGIDFC